MSEQIGQIEPGEALEDAPYRQRTFSRRASRRNARSHRRTQERIRSAVAGRTKCWFNTIISFLKTVPGDHRAEDGPVMFPKSLKRQRSLNDICSLVGEDAWRS